MPTSFLAPYPKFRATYPGTNLPIVGGLLYTYAAGTTTPLATYTDPAGGTANANPVVLNASGEADVYFVSGSLYKLVLKDPLGNVLWTVDNYRGDVTSAVYADLVASTGGTLVSTKKPGTGTVTRTIADALADTLNLRDFGAACDGITADDSALVAAIAAAVAAGKTLIIDGTPLLTAAHTFSSKVCMRFQGGGGSDYSRRPASYFIKGAAVNGTGLTFAGDNCRLENLALLCETGNTGDGIAITGFGVQMDRPWVCQAGQDGIRIGQDASGANANAFVITSPRCWSNGRDGIRIQSNISPTVGAPNANAGLILEAVCLSNGGSGIYCGNSYLGTVIQGMDCESNTGYGLYLDAYARNYIIIGGDLETNTAGNLYEAVKFQNRLLDVMVQGKCYNNLSQHYSWPNVVIVADSATPGVGTYDTGKRMGWISISGGSVAVDIHLGWTAHTGATSGQAYIALPQAVNVALGALIDFTPAWIEVDGITLPAGSEPAALINNVNSRLQLYYRLDGVLHALTLPASGEIWVKAIYAINQPNYYQLTL